MAPDTLPLPLAPRPFLDEALGSWIGRLAGLYRISVHQLDATYRLRLHLTGPLTWLCPVPVSQESADRLGALTHLPATAAVHLVELDCAVLGAHAAYYCRRCVFVNPVEVESPYWKRDWLAPRAAPCPIHDLPLTRLPAGEVRGAANMPSLIRAVSRFERRRCSNASRRYSHDL